MWFATDWTTVEKDPYRSNLQTMAAMSPEERRAALWKEGKLDVAVYNQTGAIRAAQNQRFTEPDLGPIRRGPRGGKYRIVNGKKRYDVP